MKLLKKTFALMLSLILVVGMIPGTMTAHAAGYADAIESISIDGTAITNVTGTQDGTNWSYDGTRATPTIYLDNYNGGAIYVKGKSDVGQVPIEIKIKGDCSITAPAEAIKLDANNAGTIIISTDAGSTLTTNSWCGIYNAATKNPTVEFNGSGKVKINATGGVGIWAQQNPITDQFAVSGSIFVGGLVSLEANAPGSVVTYGYNSDGTGVKKVNFYVSGGASVKFTKTNASKPSPVVFSPETITVSSGYTKSLSEDGTVFRLYKPVAYTISFEGSNISPVTTNDDGTLSSLPTPTAPIPGQEFVGWYTAEEGGEKVTTDTVFTSDTTLYARWNKEVTPPATTYKVTFLDENGNALYPTESVAEGETVTKPADPEKDGYTFLGWYTDDDELFDFDTPITERTFLTAKFEKVVTTYKVTFLDENGNALYPTESVAEGETVTKPADPEKDGYTFLGWYTDDDELFDFDTPITERTFLTAKFEVETTTEYNITVTGGTASANKAVAGTSITLTAEQIDGKVFSHWEVNGATVSDANAKETTFTMGNADVNAEAIYDDCECNCHAGGIKAFFFKIINFFQKLFGQNKVCECGAKH